MNRLAQSLLVRAELFQLGGKEGWLDVRIATVEEQEMRDVVGLDLYNRH